jgi:NOL1/NOP2/fmu family ribosome biogenesis protein
LWLIFIPCLKENGVLIYSTCSYSKKEDEEILDWIVEEFGLKPLQVSIQPGSNIIESTSAKHSAFGYRFFPDKIKGEGFFIAAFKQTNPVSSSKQRETNIQLASVKEKQLLSEFVSTEGCTIFKQNEVLTLFPQQYFGDLKVLANTLYIKKAGIAAGSFKGKSFVPEHALALSTILNNFPSVELDKKTALSYLRKQDVNLSASQGWNLVKHNGLGLGWVKILPNRTNNYYPSEWRILKT